MPTDTTVRQSLTLDDYADMPRWVAWRQEWHDNKNGQRTKTKIPYDPNSNRKAEVPTNPQTYGTLREAQRRWPRIQSGAVDGIGGEGIVLGDPLNDGNGVLMGIDLDSCINSETLTKWASQIIERFASYAEISPSGRGVKIFFLVAANDAAAVQRLMNGKTRVPFAAGKHREIALDRARFYAVTKNPLYEDTSEILRTVSVDDIRWFIEEAGPAFKQLHNPTGTSSAATTSRDESGSGYGFRFLAARKAAADTFAQACAAIRADTGKAGEWARRKDERALRLAWDNAKVDNNADSETRPLVRRRIDQFERRDIQWLWAPFVPRAMITLVCGDKAVGKSSVALDMAARITTGAKWPRFGNSKEQCAPKGSVIILCKENDISRIIRPRLEAAKADLKKIHTLGYEVPDDPEQIDPLERLDTTAQLLEQHIREIGDVKLIMVDPISDYIGKIDMYRDNQVRALLNPLGRLASRYDLAFLNILHLNKKEDLSARYRGLGSVAFRNVSQSTMMVALDNDTPGRRYLAQDAANLCEQTRAVSFSMERVGAYHRVAWDDEWHDVDLEEIMANKRASKAEHAQTLLRDWLADGPVLVDTLMDKAKAAKIGWRTVQTAKTKIGAITVKRGLFGGKWKWRLP
jgi:putative DNA primase/helicase